MEKVKRLYGYYFFIFLILIKYILYFLLGSFYHKKYKIKKNPDR